MNLLKGNLKEFVGINICISIICDRKNKITLFLQQNMIISGLK